MPEHARAPLIKVNQSPTPSTKSAQFIEQEIVRAHEKINIIFGIFQHGRVRGYAQPAIPKNSMKRNVY